MLLFPIEALLKRIVLPSANRNLLNDNQVETTIGELYRWMGVMLFMATVIGSYTRRSFWSTTPVDPFAGAPYRCNKWMTFGRYEAIRRNLGYTLRIRPVFKDAF